MSHSKRNTSLAFFTNYERSQLKDRWGSQKARLTRESFLSLAACRLCLQSARDPIACRDGGHVFCRECALTNILSQKKEIQRLEREEENRHNEDKENEQDKADKVQEEAVRGFERTLMGLEPDVNQQSNKRKHQSSNDASQDDRATAKRRIDREGKSTSEQNFWMPAAMVTTTSTSSPNQRKRHPTCPSSSGKMPHSLSLKNLVPVKFTTSLSSSNNTSAEVATTEIDGKVATISCPACKKVLSGSSKAMLTVPCGHVICTPCVEKFMKPPNLTSAGKHSTPINQETPLLCYVCQTDLTSREDSKKSGKKSKEKDRIKPGLVELSSSGTGFASGGNAVVDKEGVAFQC